MTGASALPRGLPAHDEALLHEEAQARPEQAELKAREVCLEFGETRGSQQHRDNPVSGFVAHRSILES
jgi:hypothetical protein